MEALLQQLFTAADVDARKGAAAELAAAIKSSGVASLNEYPVMDRLKAAAEDAKAPLAREGAMMAIEALCQTLGKVAEPYVVPLLATILEKIADKQAPVKEAADNALKALTSILNQNAIKVVLPMLFESMEFKKLWQTKQAALVLIGQLASYAPRQLSACLPEIVTPVTESFADAKEQVKKAALETMTICCGVVGNRDIEPFIPSIVGCMASAAEVPECIHKLGATTFVQQVEAPCLSIMVPLLARGLKERATPIKRKAAVIIDNMAKLVQDPLEAAPFLPKLAPFLERNKEEVADPECRGVTERAYATLMRIQKDVDEHQADAAKKAELPAVVAALKEILGAKVPSGFATEAALTYIAGMACGLTDRKMFESDDWIMAVRPYVQPLGVSEADAAAAGKALLAYCFRETQGKAAVLEEEDEGEDLCNCEFQLAYGAKILLNNARLWLKRGRRYGLCGPNGAGKSTLMRAIANGQVDGFPPKDVLRTVYVEHDIDGAEHETPVVQFVVEDATMVGVERAEIERVLASVGFDDEKRAMPVGSLSGGWKMKLALARAMLMRADILLLDEPTNHLDVTNVAWLENYLVSLTNVTSMIVSHDSSFLDTICTDIIHYEGRQLKRYRGNLSEFVKKVPEAKSYYELKATSGLKFTFPEPGYLEGVKTKDRAILKMAHVGFTYPNTTRKIVSDVTVQVSLSSRVACIGANGAGKSTVIKLLTGEMEPNEGTVWKHPNLRMAYVAQHAFHHLEAHLDKTPNQYIQWRYATGEDREELGKVTRVLTAEEEEVMNKQHVIDGKKLIVEKILCRRKLKKGYEYEVQWQGMPYTDTTWIPRDKLEEMGFTKMLNEIDSKEAAKMGQVFKPLTAANVEKHLADFGLEAEFSSHSHMRGLSGGQKVKVVLGSAMWNNPHVVILDEPTNYLDRESLGALAEAIKEYGGGVVMISHHSEFTSALCPETWMVADGKLTNSGGLERGPKEAVEFKMEDEVIDAFGNTIKIKAPTKKNLSRKEQKARQKLREARKARGEEVTDSEEDEA